MPKLPLIADFSSGYIQRALPMLPRQGDREPWLNPQSYSLDKKALTKRPNRRRRHEVRLTPEEIDA